MAVRALLKVALSLTWCGGSLSARSTVGRDLHVRLDPFWGVPDLDVVYTSQVDEAAAQLSKWSEFHEFGLYVKMAGTDNKAFSPARVALLGISRGSKVLIFDLRHLREVPVPLPEPVAVFLEDPGRTFYGMGLSHGCGSLAFEFDAVARCVDLAGRAWPQIKRGGGIYGLFNRYVSDIDLWRPDSLETLSSQARHAYLQWAVPHYFMSFHGPPREEWVLTMSKLFAAGPIWLRVADPKHEWSSARKEWMAKRQAKAVSSAWKKLTGLRPGGTAELPPRDMLYMAEGHSGEPHGHQGVAK